MAIKFVDIEPEAEGDKPKRPTKADAPPAEREPDAAALEESVEPELLKPAPKKRGRK